MDIEFFRWTKWQEGRETKETLCTLFIIPVQVIFSCYLAACICISNLPNWAKGVDANYSKFYMYFLHKWFLRASDIGVPQRVLRLAWEELAKRTVFPSNPSSEYVLKRDRWREVKQTPFIVIIIIFSCFLIKGRGTINAFIFCKIQNCLLTKGNLKGGKKKFRRKVITDVLSRMVKILED